MAAATSASRAQIVGATRVAAGLDGPMALAHAPGDPSRLFIAEREGTIRILDLASGSLLPGEFLSIPNVDDRSEGGLLGLAFHPDYASNGKFYVNVTLPNGGAEFLGDGYGFSNHILEYQVDPGDPNASTGVPREILSYVQPQGNHNGGWIGFSPMDGYLYIASGDGGNSNDQDSDGGHTPGLGNAQDLYLEDDGSGSPARNLLGKMLRIEVNGDSENPSDDFPTEPGRNYAIPATNPFAGGVIYDDEIWAYGLRNPFRASFDRQTGDLWIGDVGQGEREEINFQPASSSGGENYGWRSREGTRVTGLTPIVGEPNDLVPPVYEYEHGGGSIEGRSVTGGYVYRGPDPALRGSYLFGDYVSSNLWQFDPADPSGATNINALLEPNVGSINQVVALGEDAYGNLYIVDLGGEVFRIDTTIALPGDYDGSGIVDQADYVVWKAQFGQNGILAADGNGDQVVDAADYTVWRNNLGLTLPFGPAAVAAGQVPEPATWAALATACLLGAAWRAGRKHRKAC